MAARNIRNIVKTFKGLDDEGRYMFLSELLEGTPTDPKELEWRVRLCTALERASVYPKESYTQNEV